MRVDKRGMLNTDIPTLENYFTKHVPDHIPDRLKHDGPFRTSRRYAPDDAPQTPNVMSIARLPSSFGKYAGGLMMVYAAETIKGAEPGANGYGTNANIKYRGGWLNGVFHSDGYWAAKYYFTIRVAVHVAASSLDGYATGWKVLNWHRNFEPLFKYISDGYAGIPSNGGSPADNQLYSGVGRYGNATDADWAGGFSQPSSRITAQRMGEWVFFSIDPGAANPENYAQHLHAIDDPIYNSSVDAQWLAEQTGWFRVKPNLQVVSTGFGLTQHGETFISESENPAIWIQMGRGLFHQTTADKIMKGVFSKAAAATQCRVAPGYPDSNYTTPSEAAPNTPGGGYANQLVLSNDGHFVVGPPPMRLVQPFGSGDYDPPELWFLWPNKDASHTIYRSRWKKGQWARPYTQGDEQKYYDDLLGNGLAGYGDNAFARGKTKYPRLNKDGWAFEHNWKKPENIVGRVPAITDYPGFSQFIINIGGVGGAPPMVEWKILRDENQAALVLVIVCQENIPVPGGDGEIINMAQRGGVHARNVLPPDVGYAGAFAALWTDPMIDHIGGASGVGASRMQDVQYAGGYETTPDRWHPGSPDARPSAIWTSISFDDGKTWSNPKQVSREMRPRDGAWATQWAWFGCMGNINATQNGFLESGCAITADGSVVIPVMETYVYALPAKGVPDPLTPLRFRGFYQSVGGGTSDTFASAWTGETFGRGDVINWWRNDSTDPHGDPNDNFTVDLIATRETSQKPQVYHSGGDHTSPIFTFPGDWQQAPWREDRRGSMGPKIGGRVPFFTGPPDAGTRVTLYCPIDESMFGVGKASPDGVIYKKPRVAT